MKTKKNSKLPINLDSLNRTQKVNLLELLNELDERLRYNKISQWFPDTGPFNRLFYSKQVGFLNAGANFKERCLFGGNRTGKSTVGAIEMAYHLTGLYPDWWEGKRFEEPVMAWAAGDSHINVRDIAQYILMGSAMDFGSGIIPKKLIRTYKTKMGIPNAVSDIWVEHVSGGLSQCSFKSYEQGRKAFQGTAQHIVWLDEECPEDVYSECLTRTMTTKGILMLTFTPLGGLTNTVKKFLPQGKFPEHNIVTDKEGLSRYITRVEWDDVPHLPEDEKRMLLASYMDHEKEARSMGLPAIGAGKVYPILESDFITPPFALSPLWPKFYGLDVGFNRTAAVFCAYDYNTDTIYIYDEIYMSKAMPYTNAEAIKRRGEWIAGVIDPSANKGNSRDGLRLIDEYRDLGLDLCPAINAVESGINSVMNRLATGRLKVFMSCQNWLNEYRIYRRDDSGGIAKNQDDHLMDATKYAVVSGLNVANIRPEDRSDGRPKASHMREISKNDITGY